jgi:transposase-like protein
MKLKKVILQSRRTYSEEFKRTQVKEYESGKLTINEICLLYGIKGNMVYRWVYKYSTYNKKKVRIVEMEESSTQKVKELQHRIKELERAVGLKQLNIDLLEKMIELAQTELDIDIKKNYNTLQSGGIKKIGGKSPTK